MGVKVDDGHEVQHSTIYVLAVVALNVVVGSGIVIVNKAVFQMYHFHFPIALTLIHTIITWVWMNGAGLVGFFEVKDVPQWKLLPLSLAHVSYISLSNLSLQLNSMGFAQIMKIAIVPTVIGLELLMFGKVPNVRIGLSVVVVCIGVAVATVTEAVAIKSLLGLLVAVGATVATALYNIWAGSKQRELGANSSQLLHAYLPQAMGMLAGLVPAMEPVGKWDHPGPDTLLGYKFTGAAVVVILLSAICGVLVSLSTFLVVGATSSLTFNVVGHVKTVIILATGVMFFGDTLSMERLLGVGLAMGGIVWYTMLVSSAASNGGINKDKPREGVKDSKDEEQALLSTASSQGNGDKVGAYSGEGAPGTKLSNRAS